MTYDPRLVQFNKLSGSSMLGWTMRLGESRLGQEDETRTAIELSNIDLTNGYTVEDSGALSIDPLTGTAQFSERFRPGVSQTVANSIDPPIKPGEHFEIGYDGVTLTWGTVLRVRTTMSAVGNTWVRKSTYPLSGVAGTMLANTASWDYLDEEPALTRLQRFYTVDTSLLTPDMVTYLGTLLAEPRDFGSSTYLDLARDFTEQTLFPVRPQSVFPSRWDRLEVVPAVNFNGVTPDPVMTDTEEWSGAAEFETTEVGTKPISLDVVKDYVGFLGGFNTVPLAGTPLPGFQLGTTRLGEEYQIPVGFQAPSVIDVYGTSLVVSKINHSFTTKSYRSQIEVVAPVAIPPEVTDG